MRARSGRAAMDRADRAPLVMDPALPIGIDLMSKNKLEHALADAVRKLDASPRVETA
jgi:hypothetical protein